MTTQQNKMRIEFGELEIGETARKNLQEVCDSNWASGGPKVAQFEKEWGNIFDYKYNVAVSSGTDACINAYAALYECGAERGDEVIVPALSFIATSNAVLAAGFKPVFVDVELHTLNIDPKKIEEAITEKTVAIAVVHTMGKPCEMDTICKIAKKHRLKVIEDACEAHGARYKGKFIGHWGDMACFSYYIAHLICCGEGGMVSTNDNMLYETLRSTRSHGRRNGELYFDHVRFGLNSKMNDMEASIGLEGIEQFWQTFFRRKNNLYYLMHNLEKYSDIAWMNTESSDEVVCPHGFSITLKPEYAGKIKELYEYLESNSIKCKRNFGSIPTQHESFKFMGHKLGDFPNAEYIGDNGLHFGIHQYLSQQDLEYILYHVEHMFKTFKSN
jgi:dTDP-4-amino-4,6-dideoxygalactose transaminase